MEQNSRVPDYLFLLEHVIEHLYGDDNLGGCTDAFHFDSLDRFFEELVISYKKFGMIIKPTQYQAEKVDPGTPVGIGKPFSFLGVSGHYVKQYNTYYPIPRRSELCFSLTRYLDTLDDKTRIDKTIALVANARMDEVLYPDFLEYAKFLLRELRTKNDGSVEITDIARLEQVIIDPKKMRHLAMGWEVLCEEKLCHTENRSAFFREEIMVDQEEEGILKSTAYGRSNFSELNRRNYEKPSAPLG